MAYAKRYAGGFVDKPTLTTPMDAAFLNAVESALLSLFDSNPASANMVPVWTPAGTHYVPQLITNASIDPAAAIAKSKLAALNIADADVAGAAAISRSKLNFGAGLVNADIATAAAIDVRKINGVPKVTTSTFAGGPPVAPTDGDIWIATAITAGGGERWMFQYDAAWAGDANKWKFIGGPPVTVNGAGGSFNGASANTSLLNSAGIPRGGIYAITGQMYGIASAGGAGTYELLYYVGGVSQGNYAQMGSPASFGFVCSGTPEVFAVVATNAIGIGYWANNTGSIGTYGFTYVPVRVI